MTKLITLPQALTLLEEADRCDSVSDLVKELFEGNDELPENLIESIINAKGLNFDLAEDWYRRVGCGKPHALQTVALMCY